MGGKEVSPLIVIAAVAAVVILIGYIGYRAVMPPTPPPGSYTPGVPPWMDKKNSNYGKSPVPPSGGPAGTLGH